MPGGSLFCGVLIVFLIALNAFAWIFCIFVFGNPEVPFNYAPHLTEQTRKYRGFTPVTAPRGKFKDAVSSTLSNTGIWMKNWKPSNGLLKRAYLDNYDGKLRRGLFEWRIQNRKCLTADEGRYFPLRLRHHGTSCRLPSGMSTTSCQRWIRKIPLGRRKKLLELTRNKKDKDKNALKQLRALDKVSQVTTEDLTSCLCRRCHLEN
ncbi:MAG: hypothetical protein R3F31_16320 [Verrucomicrobiales bacterium]